MTKQSESKPKKNNGFKIALLLLGLLEIGLIITAFTYIFSTIFDYPLDFEKLMTGYIFLGIFVGVLILVFPILMIAFVTSRRKQITKTFHNISSSASTATAAALAPYSASYRPTKSGKVYYCNYCGYEVKSHERECPECSGPIKRGVRVN